jgi:ribose-phosphate pyrophosphokinase
MDSRRFQIFSGNASLELGAKIASHYGCELGKLDISVFADGERQPRIGQSIRGDEVFLVQSTYAPADNIMELLLMIDAVKRSSANSINVVIPYFGYARQDRKDRPRVSIGAKLMANLLTAAGANRVITMDLHAGQIQGFFDIPLDNLDASAVFIPYFQALQLDNLTIASPDMGGTVRARMYAKHLKANLVLVDKHRERANEVASMQLIGEVTDRNVIIVDDIVDTAGTLTKAADYILQCGAKSVRAAVTHPLLSGPAVERIENSTLLELVTTDTIPLRGAESSKIKVLSIAGIFAKALSKIFYQESVSSLFLT